MSRRYRRRNPKSDARMLWVGGIAVAAAAAGYAVWKMTGPASALAANTGPKSITVTPGVVNQVTMSPGNTLTINLPSGYVWGAGDSVYATLKRTDITGIRVPTSGSAPATVTLSAPSSVFSIIYYDSSGAMKADTVRIN